MKKFLRVLVVVLGIIVLGIIILCIIEPKELNITRSIVIAAPKEVVWDKIVHYKSWPEWSAWHRMEPDMKITYAGEDGKEGSSYHYSGNQVGEGIMTNVGTKADQMNWKLEFVRPWSGSADGNFNLKDSAGWTKVIWFYHQKLGYPTNAMGAFVSMDKILGGQFEDGLSMLKKICEGKASTMPSIAVTETEFPAHMYAGARKVVGWADITKFFNENGKTIAKEAGTKISGPMAGLYWTWDTTNHNTDCGVVFPVSDTSKPIKGASFFYVAASKAYMTVLKGPYSGEMAAHNAVMKYETGKGKKHTLVVEDYVVSPDMEKDSTKWITNIYYLEP